MKLWVHHQRNDMGLRQVHILNISRIKNELEES